MGDWTIHRCAWCSSCRPNSPGQIREKRHGTNRRIALWQIAGDRTSGVRSRKLKPNRNPTRLLLLRCRFSGSSRRLGSRNLLFEHFASRKCGHSRCRNLDCLASAGVATFAGLAIAGFERPETDQRHFVFLGHSFHDCFDHRADDRIRFFLGDGSLGCNCINQFAFVHELILQVN
jgi:hypothetical protein